MSGLIVSQYDWQQSLERLKLFRKEMRNQYGLKLREEIHASELIRINKIDSYRQIRKRDRIKILENFISQLPIIFNNSKIINVCFNKSNIEQGKDIQLLAWSRLIERYDLYLKKVVNDKGIIISDTVDEAKVRQLLRKMRVYNPVKSHYGGSYNNVTDNILEDIFMRDSKSSYFIQAVDSVVQALYRMEFPKTSLKKYNIDKFFSNLEPILLYEASKTDDLGIVRK